MKTINLKKSHTLYANMLPGILLAMAASSCLSESDDESKSTKISIGNDVPAFTADVTLTDTADWRYCAQGNYAYDSQSAIGRRGVVVFFHTLCNDCRRELPVIQAFYDKVKADSTISLVCISRAESNSEVLQYWDQQRFTLPVSPQPDRRIYEMFASSVIPRTYIIDRRGKVTNIFTDRDTLTVERLEEVVRHAAG